MNVEKILDYRIEKDILGEIKVPSNVYWGINTQRALKNFKISGKTFSEILIPFSPLLAV